MSKNFISELPRLITKDDLESQSLKLYKYLDLEKFIKLLSYKKIEMSKPSKWTDEDKWEGAFLSENFPLDKYALCFTDSVESYAMWKIFLKDKFGVRIKIDAKVLLEADSLLSLGKVGYFKRNAYRLAEKEALENVEGEGNKELIRCLLKRSAFEYEHEYRLLSSKQKFDFDWAKNIELVQFHPGLDDDFVDFMKKILHSKFRKLTCELRKSTLNEDV